MRSLNEYIYIGPSLGRKEGRKEAMNNLSVHMEALHSLIPGQESSLFLEPLWYESPQKITQY